VGLIHWNAKRKRARGGRVVLDQQDPQSQRAEHDFERYRPHLLVAAARAICTQKLAGVSGGEAPEPIDFQSRKTEFVGALPAGVDQCPVIADRSAEPGTHF
jgi:hypothetical protein